MTVATGMIAVEGLVTSLAVENSATQRSGTATLNGMHSSEMAGKHLVAVLLAIVGSMLVKDIGQFGHKSAISRWTVSAARLWPSQVRWV